MQPTADTAPNFIDIGLNLTNSKFDKDRALVIAQAVAAGISKFIITGTNANESQAALQLAQDNSNLYSTAGCHPHDAAQMSPQDFALIKELVSDPNVVAIGECGLDFNRNFSPPDIQQSVFRQQLELACELKKPLFIHERDASDTLLAILSEFDKDLPAVVIHCFTGSQAALETYLERDFYIGITGWICDERRGQELAKMVHLIPDNRIMLETDAPYLIPRDLKPKPKSNRNLPQYLVHIAKKVAHCRQQAFEQLAKNSYQNTVKFFRLSDDINNKKEK